MLMSCSSPRPMGFPHQRRPARSRRSTWYRLANAKSIALIGSGLTMVGVLLSARRDGFQGKATVISRRGQLPRPHAAKGVAQQEIGLARSKRVSGLTSAIAIGCAAAEAHGTPWQAIINGLRSSMQARRLAGLARRRASSLPAPRPALVGRASPSPAG